MNKKSLLNLAMCSLLLGSMPMGLVGCKDYDGDIKDLNTTTGDLSSQISSLKTALDAANTAATNAANDAKAAADKADTATQEVALAKKAAEEAKAEAIAAAIAEVEKLQSQMSDMNAETAKELAALSGRIDGIEKGLSNIDLTKVDEMLGGLSTQIQEANTQISAINVQLKALESLKTDVPAMKSSIEAIQADLKTVKGKAEANTASINEIKGDLAKISTKISTEVSNAINTIAGILSQRLTSVTLVPELYVGGIPTIEFQSAKYTKKVFKDNKWVAATEGQKEFIITNNSTTAQYRLNPGTLKIEDIDVAGMEYVTKIATTRAGDPKVVTVANAKVEDNGLLTVNLGKATTTSLNLADNKIYTVSLKVPVASKHLFDGENSAEVYSEFTRLSETYFQPELRFVKDAALVSADKNGHLWNDSTTLYSSAAGKLVAKNIVYNQTFDLSTLVEGCKFLSTTHTNLKVADLEKYGLGIKYQVATKAYETSTTDKTNQQKFAKIDGNILTPIAASGAEDNKNIIGKEPIIRATLYDLNNNNVIEVGYFKVKFTAENMQPVVFNLPVTDNGAACTGATHNFTWDYMAEEVLEKLNGGSGMSKSDFNRIYDTTPVISAAATGENTDLTVTPVSTTDVSTPVMVWTAGPSDLGVLKVGENSKEFKRTVTFKNSEGLYPDVVLNLTWTVKTTVAATTLGTTNAIKWNNNTMKVTVVPMAIPYVDGQTAVYNTNILEGRNKPYVNGLLSCAQYNIEYAPASAQTESYLGEPLTGFTAWSLTAENQADLTAVNYTIANDAKGKNLASNGGTIKVNFNSDINGLAQNRYTIGTINLEVVKILTIGTTTANGITDNSAAVSMNIKDNLLIKDAYNNVVATQNTTANPHAADYWKFYVIKNPVFDSSAIKVATSATATDGVTLASLNMTANVNNSTGVLTFQNNGSAIQSDCYLLVPVTVAHKWGVLKGTVAVPLKKKL